MLKKIKSRLNHKNVLLLIPTLLGLFFLFYFMVRTFSGEVKDAITHTKVSINSLIELSDTFEDTLQENFYLKNDFVNLDGLRARVLGIHTENNRIKMANGFLTQTEEVTDTSYASDSIIDLDKFLVDRGINFVYVLAPSKSAIYDADYAPGYSSDSWQNIDTMIDAVTDAGVNAIDMDAWFEANGWDTEDVFYRTDHHWLPQAAMEAARCTMELLSQQGLAEYDVSTLDEQNWTVTTYQDWFLGSHGKRTGSLYTGTDDFSLYIPNFKSEYTYSYLKRGSTSWVTTDTILNLKYLDKADYFNDNIYYLYMIGDYPIRMTINDEAANDQRILIMGGSYKVPYEYFLTTQFKEVYTIDLRFYTDGTFVQYLEEIQPDIVLMCTYSATLSNYDMYTFGVTDYLVALDETDSSKSGLGLGDFTLKIAEGSKNVFDVVVADLEQGQTYTMIVDSTSYTGEEEQYIRMTLQNLSTNKSVYNRYFNANSDKSQKWIFDVPDEEGTYAIYLYSGTEENASVEVTGVTLFDGIVE